MKNMLKIPLMVFMLNLWFVSQANAVTVWYQPTPYPTQTQDGTHVVSGWFGSYYNQTLVWNDNLKIGGWGDYYTSPIKFDLEGLPAAVDSAYLYLYAIPSGSANPSQVSLFRISSTWDSSTIGWNNFPSVDAGYYWPVSTSVNTWRSYYITGWYTAWKNGTSENNGVLIWPYNNDGNERIDMFVSSKSSDDGKRPILRLDFTPTIELKMPLPGSLSWAVTTEVGGWDSVGNWHDSAHDGDKYFSLDFSWRNKDANGSVVYSDPNIPANNSNIPIIAAAGGKVVFARGADTTGNPNGFYVVIDHDSDGNLSTGFSTWYTHLKNDPAAYVYEGKTVQQGDQVGIMGTTGKDSNGNPTSTGVHLHFGVKYNGSGTSSIPELTKVVMDGWILKSFQTERVDGIYNNRYYSSGNTEY